MGGSTDKTLNIINKYKRYITYFISEPDNGMYDAINKGFSKASSDIFCYLNSDDRLLSNAFEIVAKTFNKLKVDLIYGDVNYIDSNGDVLYTYKSLALPNIFIEYLRRLTFAEQSAFWSKKAYEKIGGFDSSLKYVADSKFFFQICLNKEFSRKRVNTVLGEFRLHRDSFSIDQKQKMQIESRKMRENVLTENCNIIKIIIEIYVKTYNIYGIFSKYKNSKIKL